MKIGDKLRAIQSHPLVIQRRETLKRLEQMGKEPNMRFVRGKLATMWCVLQTQEDDRWVFVDGLNKMASEHIFHWMQLK